MLRTYGARARYNILTPFAALVALGVSPALALDVAAGTSSGPVTLAGESLANAGTIAGGADTAVSASGAIASLANAASGTISSAGNSAINVDNGSLVASFYNAGLMSSGVTPSSTVQLSGGVTSFLNDATGRIANGADGSLASFAGVAVAINVDGSVGGAPLASFVNRGSIVGGKGNTPDNSGPAVAIYGNFDVAHPTPSAVGSFLNSGTISNATATALYMMGGANAFTNSGTISGAGYQAINIELQGSAAGAGLTSFVNDVGGLIQNTDATKVKTGETGGAAINFNTDSLYGGTVVSFINRGTILGATNGTTKSGPDAIHFGDWNDGLPRANAVGSFVNDATGIIRSQYAAVGFRGLVQSFTNAGEITGGGYQALAFDSGVTTFTNSGTIANTDGTHVDDGDTGGTAIGINVGHTLGAPLTSFTNSGTISAYTPAGVITPASYQAAVNFYYRGDKGDSAGTITSIANSGTITGPGAALGINARVTNFTNSGTILGAGYDAIAFQNGVANFVNTASGVIRNTDATLVDSGRGGEAIIINIGSGTGSNVASFINAGRIEGASNQSGNFSNTIVFGYDGEFEQAGTIGTVLNTGTIAGGGRAMAFYGAVASFTNTGSIVGGGYDVLAFDRGVGSFANSGSISNTDATHVQDGDSGGKALWINIDTASGTTLQSFVNSGTIAAAANQSGSYTSTVRLAAESRDTAGTIQSLVNTGLITGPGTAIGSDGLVSSFVNSGQLVGAGYETVYFDKGVTRFTNSGLIVNTDATHVDSGDTGGGQAVFINIDGAPLESFANTGTITGAANQSGQYADTVHIWAGSLASAGAIGNFVNTGTITGPGRAISLAGAVASFANSGLVSGAGYYAISFRGGVASFSNAEGGIIRNTDATHVDSGDSGGNAIAVSVGSAATAVRSFINSGSILGATNQAADSINATIGFYAEDGDTASAVGSFVNSATGLIQGPGGIDFAGGVLSLSNDGRIIATAADNATGVSANGAIASLVNTGVIQGPVAVGVWEGALGTLRNSGQLIGTRYAAVYSHAGPTTIVNSGLIRGANGTAISLSSGNDRVALNTGSRIVGAIDFGGGSDTLDVSGLSGNALLSVKNFDMKGLVTGSRNVISDAATGQVAVFDISSQSGGTLGRVQAGVTTSIANLGAGQIAAPGPVPESMAASAYAAAPKSTPAASAATAIATTAPANSPYVWASGVASRLDGSDDSTTTLGGIVIGSHARLDGGVTLGGLGGYVESRTESADGQQTHTSHSALLGLYGSAGLGSIDFDFGVQFGLVGNATTRTIAAVAGDETASGSFTSTIFAPSASVRVPVLAADGTSLALKGSAALIVGASSAYTETGSSMNLSVGAQSFSVVDGRLGLELRQQMGAPSGPPVTLSAEAGVLVAADLGDRSVPVTVLGKTIDVGGAAQSSLGAYGGLHVDARLADRVTLRLGVDGTARADGATSGALRATVGGVF